MKAIIFLVTLLCLSAQASEKKTDNVCKPLEGNFQAKVYQTILKMKDISLNFKNFGAAIDKSSGMAPFTITCNSFTDYTGRIETCYSKCQAFDLDGQVIDMTIQYENWRSGKGVNELDLFFDVSHISFNSGI